MVRLIIGIDPDVEKNGVATVDKQTNEIQVSTLAFPQLIKYLKDRSKDCTILVLIEAGWLNHSNWHLSPKITVQKAAQIGNATGRNHETGRKIAEMCEYYKIPYKLIKPLKKIWRGTDGKISAAEFSRITGCSARTNQEMRDAGLIAWFYK